MIQTTGDLITFVLRASGINGQGQTPTAEDSDTGLTMLRNLIAQWQRKRWMTYVAQEVSVPSATGAQSYTIGPGNDFNCARPTSIKSAYVRILNPTNPNLVDLPLSILTSREEYSAIRVKNLSTIPAAVWLETSFPTARVWFWPVPPAGVYGLYLTVPSPLPTYTRLTDPLNLPPEYYEALVWSLCCRMQMAYGLPARQDHAAAMNQALATLRSANVQIPQAAMPVPGGRGGSGIAALSSPEFQSGIW